MVTVIIVWSLFNKPTLTFSRKLETVISHVEVRHFVVPSNNPNFFPRLTLSLYYNVTLLHWNDRCSRFPWDTVCIISALCRTCLKLDVGPLNIYTICYRRSPQETLGSFSKHGIWFPVFLPWHATWTGRQPRLPKRNTSVFAGERIATAL